LIFRASWATMPAEMNNTRNITNPGYGDDHAFATLANPKRAGDSGAWWAGYYFFMT
jgi:hypothetical protein